MPGFTNVWIKFWDFYFMEVNAYNIGRVVRGIIARYKKKDNMASCKIAPWLVDRITAIDN